jgi:hypothetical protein
MSPAGYSGTPLWKKLGIKPGLTVLTLGAPGEYRSWLDDPPAGVRLTSRGAGPFELIHFFTAKRSELEGQLAALEAKLAPGGALWVSWPKQASKVETDITEDTIRQVVLPRGLVDVKVCAVSAVWSGLKLMRRRNR